MCDYVACKEANYIAVLTQLVNHTGIAFVQFHVPRWGFTVDGERRLAQIADDIYASGVQKVHAGLVVCGRVDRIGTDRVGSERLEERDVTLAVGFVRKRIGKL